jgi:hypothetical protein
VKNNECLQNEEGVSETLGKMQILVKLNYYFFQNVIVLWQSLLSRYCAVLGLPVSF